MIHIMIHIMIHDFYPRSPRGERLLALCLLLLLRHISIHAPREGSDDYRYHPNIVTGISIHAPREGSDLHRRGGLSP